MTRLTHAVMLAVVSVCLGTAGSALGQTTRITFDTDATGAPLSAPCLFQDTVPLTDAYSSLGVHFSGPGELLGGAILNECGNFGLPARSGANFLGFNIQTYGQDPETIRFDAPQRTVTIFAGASEEHGAGSVTFTLVAYRGTTEVDRDVVVI